MRGRFLAVVATLALALAALVWVVVRPRADHAPAPSTQARSVANESSFSLRSEQVDLPADLEEFPDRPGVAAVSANCTACHSAGMILTQPPLSRKQWTAIITKMQTTFHAPVVEDDIPAILTYLVDLSAVVEAESDGD